MEQKNFEFLTIFGKFMALRKKEFCHFSFFDRNGFFSRVRFLRIFRCFCLGDALYNGQKWFKTHENLFFPTLVITLGKNKIL